MKKFKPWATEETIKHRQEICLNCDRLFKPTFTCLECGCFLKVKTTLNRFSCPLKKWPAMPTHE